jgi:hypothetical protein
MINPVVIRSLSLILVAMSVLGGCRTATAPNTVATSGSTATAKSPTSTTEGGPNLLLDGDFDVSSARAWNFIVHADPDAFKVTVDESERVVGGSSLRFDPTGSEPWGGIDQTVDVAAVAGRTLRLSAWVRGRDLSESVVLFGTVEQGAFAHPVETAFGQLGSDFDWQQVAITIPVPERATRLRVGVTLYGLGVLWVDDVRLVLIEE